MKTDGPILFISHKKQQCGVYQFGLGISKVLESSSKFRFRYVECNDAEAFLTAVNAEQPSAVIYNHHPATMPWLSRDLIRRFETVHLGVMHETTQALADDANREVFDYHISPDPTLLLRNPIVFKTGRLVLRYQSRYDRPEPAVPTIGSFGFGTKGKGFQRLILKVQEDFDQATIKLRIPFSAFFDPDGTQARSIGEECRRLIVKPGITLELHHDFLSQDDLMDFLASNSLNAFLYEDQTGRGISSVIDFALAAGRPLAVTKSSMFRHVNRSRPSITVEDSRLSEILSRGSSPVARYAQEWTAENLVWDYERIIASVLHPKVPARRTATFDRDSPSFGGIKDQWLSRENLRRASRSLLKRVAPTVRSARKELMSSPLRTLVEVAQGQPILKAGLGAMRRYLATLSNSSASPTAADRASENQLNAVIPPFRPDGAILGGFNRILAASASQDYQRATEYLTSHVSGRSSIEQAFVLDTVSRLTSRLGQSTLLGIGSHGRPASIALAKSGLELEEIDPVINYDLETYLTKPTRRRSTFDIVFAANVIGKNTADARFLRHIQDLLAPGGIGIVMCAVDPGRYLQQFGPMRRDKPFSVEDLDRLPAAMEGCELVDRPRWRPDVSEPSETINRQTVATLVFRKVASDPRQTPATRMKS